MLGCYVALALRSLERARVLTSLMVLAIGLGIGASMTMITVLHVMSSNPLPKRSAKLFVRAPGESDVDGRLSTWRRWADRLRRMSLVRDSDCIVLYGGYVLHKGHAVECPP